MQLPHSTQPSPGPEVALLWHISLSGGEEGGGSQTLAVAGKRSLDASRRSSKPWGSSISHVHGTSQCTALHSAQWTTRKAEQVSVCL